MAEDLPKAWWRQKRWWIATVALATFVLVDLVAAFRLTSDKDLRSSILGLLTPVVALIAGAAALLNFQETRRQNLTSLAATRESLELSRRGQVTERFTNAIEQLGSGKLDIRIGGIYALEQIARDSKELHWPIMQILTSHLREESEHVRNTADANKEAVDAESEPVRETNEMPRALGEQLGEQLLREFAGIPDRSSAPPNCLAIADVLRRRRLDFDPVEANEEGIPREPLNLKGCELQGADLRGAHLPGADFQGAQLYAANFEGAHLQGADFSRAELGSANFEGALMNGAHFDEAHITSANFGGAKLNRAYFSQATAAVVSARFDAAELERAFFGDADLNSAGFREARLKHTSF